MPKIVTYSTVTPSPTDLIPGTDVSDSNKTVNYTAQGIANLAPVPSLDAVLNVGNSSSVDVILNSELTVNKINFSTSTQTISAAGQMGWNDDEGTLDLGLKGGSVVLQIGQELVVRALNKTGAPLLESEFRVVRVTGAQGDRLSIDFADASDASLSQSTIGVVTESFDNNQQGFVTTFGIVRNINTTGSPFGESWAEGDPLYLSDSTPGHITNVEPTSPSFVVRLGYVVRVNANNGMIFVKVDSGYLLGEIHDILISAAQDGDVLIYESATGLWKNVQPTMNVL
jgi:hypothetical protein